MTDHNNITIIGRLTRDPETKSIGDTTVTNFSIASNYEYKRNNEKISDVTFIDCQVWGKLGSEVIQKYSGKGKQILIAGRLKMESWESPDGKTNRKHVIRVESVQLLGGKSDGEGKQPEPEPVAEDEEIF